MFRTDRACGCGVQHDEANTRREQRKREEERKEIKKWKEEEEGGLMQWTLLLLWKTCLITVNEDEDVDFEDEESRRAQG